MQFLYNQLSNHMLTQFHRSTLDNVPAYRGDTGLKGPVGSLIKDEHYSPSIEGDCVLSPNVIRALKLSRIKTSNKLLKMLLGFQLIHDEVATKDWRKKIRVLGQLSGLNPIGE